MRLRDVLERATDVANTPMKSQAHQVQGVNQQMSKLSGLLSFRRVVARAVEANVNVALGRQLLAHEYLNVDRDELIAEPQAASNFMNLASAYTAKR